jgi:hypothetical protein
MLDDKKKLTLSLTDHEGNVVKEWTLYDELNKAHITYDELMETADQVDFFIDDAWTDLDHIGGEFFQTAKEFCEKK